MTALITFLPIYLQTVAGATPAETGMLLIPLTGAVSVGSVLTGWLISRSGRTAVFPSIGLTITAVSLVGLALWAPALSRGQLSWVLAIGALTQGSSMITATITVQAIAGPRFLGAAAAMVTRQPMFIRKLPSPCRQMMRLSGRPSASPSACEESSPIAPMEK